MTPAEKILERSLIGEPHYTGPGCYTLPVRGRAPLALELREAMLFVQLGRLLDRVADWNRGPCAALAGSADERALRAVAHELLDDARAKGFREGELTVAWRGLIFHATITGWDCQLLDRYDALLERVSAAKEV